ncbi:hypothetical protein CEW87_17875 [Parazoarcus communis]|uniref:Uncharacterized protein n=1 Tax=Parazoarcus communis TaxID=41977 RepID=A0A2U8H8K6_9RHOO|nr:hypothetical protein [Parazoarcus communis]AWI81065.1 hypothetical protein CEW87_17875 [Parazoarcus communis]
MRRLFLTLAAATTLLLVGLSLLVVASLDSSALVRRSETISPAAVAEARRLLALNDPRQLQPGQSRLVMVPARLIDEGVNHLAARFGGGQAAFSAAARQAEIRVTLPVPLIPVERYLNLRADLSDDGKQLRIDSVRVGSLSLPPQSVLPLIQVLAGIGGYAEEWRLVRSSVGRIAIAASGNRVDIAYVWLPELLSRARALALPSETTQQLEAAQRDLAGLLGFRAQGQALPLPAVLKPMLQGGDDASLARRRAALLVLASYLAGRDLAAVIPEAAAWPRPSRRELTLHGREDTAQHFIISAALSAWAGEPIADAIGLYKELEDARSGSGFSFADLAADRAGTRFGKLLTDDPARIDTVFAAPVRDADLVPILRGLPEYIAEAEFRRRFGNTESAPYRQLVAEVERRISALPLYR